MYCAGFGPSMTLLVGRQDRKRWRTLRKRVTKHWKTETNDEIDRVAESNRDIGDEVWPRLRSNFLLARLALSPCATTTYVDKGKNKKS